MLGDPCFSDLEDDHFLSQGNVRMLVDAEQTYMQPAIDAVTLALQMTYNREAAVVMNTYQCYLKVSFLH